MGRLVDVALYECDECGREFDSEEAREASPSRERRT